MSLGLPEFGARGQSARPGFWRVVQGLGFVVLAWVAVLAALEWKNASADAQSLERARSEAASVRRAAEDARRLLHKNGDLLIAAQSIGSSPETVLADLESALPASVTITSLKVEYLPDEAARVDFNVVAASPQAYDRFLNALSKSPSFFEIRPGAESRPGSVRAVVSARHRARGEGPKGAAR